ncbi:type I polyketide synthase [Amycolatopsis sp. PS_44_ISF1]|nr:type I polyketide synthase [Amycolatopsis sp. PS_44_ISF1]
MGRELWESEPVFAARMEECGRALSAFVDWSLREVVFGDSWGGVEVVQPVSWAVMVSLAALWESCGVVPDAVVGHSQGEIAAACVSGALSLEDGAKVVALRSQVIASGLAGRGGMLSVGVSVDEVPEGVEVAAVNGPRSVVLSGASGVLERLEERYRAAGVRVRRVEVDYASHSAQVDAVAGEVRSRLGGVGSGVVEIPWLSTVDVGWVEEVEAAYWVRNLREPVRFADAVAELGAQGFDLFVECSPHPVLTAAVLETVPDAIAVGSLRREDGGRDRFLRSLAEVFVHGGTVDWRRVVPEAPLTEAPTTAFAREHYWLIPPKPTGDVAGAGLEPVPHPVLGAFVENPETGGGVLTGRLSPQAQPWLADHAVAGAVVVPGAVWVELALQGGAVTGCPGLDELVVEFPLVLGPEPVPVQVVVGAEQDGRRPVSVHARAAEGRWTRHATGTLATTGDHGETFEWPPAGAEPVADLYATLAGSGYEYGPAFQGVRSLWRRGDELFAEVTLPGEADAEGFAIHPALLDASLHPAALSASREDGRIELPFAWQRLRLHGRARSLRVRIRRNQFAAVDLDGRPVFTLGELTSRPVAVADLRPVELFRLDWVPVPLSPGEPGNWRIFPVETGTGPDAERARRAVAGALEAVQALLAGAGDTRLVVLTRAGRTDPAEAAVWGLVRAAQAEHPGRLFLLDGECANPAGVAEAAAARGEGQLTVRDGQFFAPRLVRAEPGPGLTFGAGTRVLITGGTGTLGTLVAGHLAAEHGVREIVLASRTGTGDRFETHACDVSDRAQVRELLAETRPDVVIHAAGALADGPVGSLDPAGLDQVFGPKADAFGHLDELAPDATLIVFSSAAGVLGNAGQANYAAANAFLDAAIARRRAAGGAGVSVAWGLWAEASAMTGHLTGGQRDRMARAGVAPIGAERGLRMFDAALKAADPVVVGVLPDLAALRSAARSGSLPAIWRAVVPPPRKTVPPEEDLLGRLSEMDEERRRAALTELVRREAAVVLGRAKPVQAATAFRDLGFDSLTSVELRNRLGAATGAKLPVTAVFDHPNAAALGERLDAGLFGRPPAEDPAFEDPALENTGPAAAGETTAELAEMDAESLIRRALGEL